MKLHLTEAAGNNLITAYEQGWVEINRKRHTANLILLPTQLIENWGVSGIDAIEAAHISQIADYKPEVVLIGTGAHQKFIPPKLSIALTEMGISAECMTTIAACRTYNILMSEGRVVAAALIL